MTQKHKIANAVHAALLVTSAATLSFSNPVWAADEEEAEKTESIIITGSRIRRDEANDTIPIDIIVAEDAVNRGIATVGQLLRQSSLVSGSSQLTAATTVGFVRDGGNGAESVSLRGLGAQRTLVLLNGRRAGPAGTRGSVNAFDFNSIPLSAVERIDILKDGASSLYGSDAVAGVINIVTKKSDGGSVEAFLSAPGEGGGESARVSGSWGTSTQDAIFQFTFDFTQQSEMTRGDRDYLGCTERLYYSANSNFVGGAFRLDPRNPDTGEIRCDDRIWGEVIYSDLSRGLGIDLAPDASNPVFLSDLQRMRTFLGVNNRLVYNYFTDADDPRNLARHPNFVTNLADLPTVLDGQGFGINLTPSAPNGFYLLNGTSPVLPENSPYADQETFIPDTSVATIMATGDYELGNNMNLYGEFLINQRETEINGTRQIFKGNIPTLDTAAALGGTYNGMDPAVIGSTAFGGLGELTPVGVTDHSGSTTTVDYTRFVLGVNGELGEWFWDTHFQFSRNDGEYTDEIFFKDSMDREVFDPALGRVRPDYLTPCAGTQTPVRGVDCIDIPWFDPAFLYGTYSPELRAFMTGTETGTTVYEQTSFEATITGDLGELPAGFVGSAFGFAYKQDSIVDTPGAQTLIGNAWQQSRSGITEGIVESYAAFFELDIPLVRDVPFAEELNLSLSSRYTDVPDAGQDTTYKVGLAWQVGSGVSVRGSHGTSFRAPALYELFLADQSGFLNITASDPCLNWGTNPDLDQEVQDRCLAEGVDPNYNGAGAGSTEVFSTGGWGVLESETSTANTWGIVFRPEGMNLSIALDWFDFVIEDEVRRFGVGGVLNECYFEGNQNFCDRITREGGTSHIIELRNPFVNLARQENSGYDLRVDYLAETDVGEFYFRTEQTLQEVDRSSIFGDDVTDSNGAIREPKHTGIFEFTYRLDNVRVTWFTNYTGKVDDSRFTSEFFNFSTFGNWDNFDNDFEIVQLDATPGSEVYSYRTARPGAAEQARRILRIGSRTEHTFSVGYEHEESGIQVVAGVRNVFDKEPPEVSRGVETTFGNTPIFATQYDKIGRSYFLNFRYGFE